MIYKLKCSTLDDYVKIIITGSWPSNKPDKIFDEMYLEMEKNKKKNYLLILEECKVRLTLEGTISM